MTPLASRRPRRRSSRAWSLPALLLCALPGCFGGAAVEEHFYSLSGPRTPLEKNQGPRLLVADLAPAAGYDTSKLAYRVSENELRYYAFRQWVSDPPRMVTEMIIRHLRASGRFSQVSRGDKLRDPDAVLEGTIDAIEEVDAPDSWKARLAMTFTLRRGDTEKIAMRHAFDVVMPCAKRSPEEVARTVSSILARESERLARLVANAIH
jgi:ABC-type uncharacterized transport system auxiliary subunit